jgi:hypothetical protein
VPDLWQREGLAFDDRVRAPATTLLSRSGDTQRCVGVIKPSATPVSVGCTPDRSQKNQIKVPRRKYSGILRTPSRAAPVVTRRPIAIQANACTFTPCPYPIAMTRMAPMSSKIASERTKIRRLGGMRDPSSARQPTAKAVSVAVTVPHAPARFACEEQGRVLLARPCRRWRRRARALRTADSAVRPAQAPASVRVRSRRRRGSSDRRRSTREAASRKESEPMTKPREVSQTD